MLPQIFQGGHHSAEVAGHRCHAAMGAMRDLTENRIRLEIQEIVILPQVFQGGRHSAEIAGRYRTRTNPAWASDRIAFLRICGNDHDSLRSRCFLRIARSQISEGLVSVTRVSAISILEIQDSAIQVLAARSSGRICRSFRTCSWVVCFA